MQYILEAGSTDPCHVHGVYFLLVRICRSIDMVPLTVIPALLPNNKEFSVASDSSGNSCQCKKQYVRG